MAGYVKSQGSSRLLDGIGVVQLEGLPVSGLPINGYNCAFPIKGTPVWMLWVAHFRFPI